MDQKITVRYKYTLSDFIQAGRVYRTTTLEAKIDKIVAVVLLLAIGMIMYSDGIQWWTILMFLLVPFAWFGLIQPLQTWITFKRDPTLYTEEYEITFDDSGIYAKNSTTEARRLWNAYNIAFESNQFFLLAYGKRAYSTIPKQAFSNENEVNIFRKILKEKIGKLENIG